MIGTRLGASLLAVAGVAVLVGPHARDPAVGVAAEGLVRARAEAATRELDELRGALAVALDEARAASTATVSGPNAPGPAIGRAADAIEAVVPQSRVARDAVARLNGALAAWRSAAEPVPTPEDSAELASIASQLRASEAAASSFAALREGATGLPETLDAALTALDDSDVATAENHLVDARAARALVEAWEAAPTTTVVWLETTGAMIGAVEELVGAVRGQQAERAAAAADRFAALSDDAEAADRALRIALSEGGAGVLAAPLGRLADVARAADEARAVTAAIARGDGS